MNQDLGEFNTILNSKVKTSRPNAYNFIGKFKNYHN